MHLIIIFVREEQENCVSQISMSGAKTSRKSDDDEYCKGNFASEINAGNNYLFPS